MSLGEKIAQGIQFEMDMKQGIALIVHAVFILIAYFLLPKWGVPIVCAGMIARGVWLVIRYIFIQE